jgi:hypothetical protein
VYVAFNYVTRAGQRVRKNTTTYQDRWLAINLNTNVLIANYLDEIRPSWPRSASSYAITRTCSPTTRPLPGVNPDTATYKAAETTDAAGVKLTSRADGITSPAGFSLVPSTCGIPPPASATAVGGGTILRRYAYPVPEVDQRAAP